jgi:hypothetical protein
MPFCTGNDYPPEYPFQGKNLAVFRHAHRNGRLRFVPVFPDGSRSLTPADWTDYESPVATHADDSSRIAWQEDLFRLRKLADALLWRLSGNADLAPLPTSEESHATIKSELHQCPRSADTHLGTT